MDMAKVFKSTAAGIDDPDDDLILDPLMQTVQGP